MLSAISDLLKINQVEKNLPDIKKNGQWEMVNEADIPHILSVGAGWLGDVFTLFSPFGTDSRFHWTGLSAFLVLGIVLYLFEKRRSTTTYTNWVQFLFPSALYKTASSWVDVKVYFANRLVKPFMSAITIPLTALVMSMTAGLFQSTGLASEAAAPSFETITAASILVVLLADFAYYVTHRWSHESEWLWPFHKLHHSAEVLTPITAKRNHPIFDLLLQCVTILIVAPISGVIFGLFGIFEIWTILGLNLLIAFMNVTGGAMRHSHIWLDFGPVLDRIFISPAQHQIHHSMAVKHHDKNYGLTLAVWDWMFGTLYIPKSREELAFGVADREGRAEPQVHNTLSEAYIVPFQESVGVLRTRRAYPEQDCA